MLDYQDLVKEVMRHDENERQALIEEIQRSLQPTPKNGATNHDGPQSKAGPITYIGKLDETGQPVVTVRSADGQEESLPISPLVKQFSDKHYSWGATGPGLVQLGHSLLYHLFDITTADDFTNKFAYDVLRVLPKTGWQLSREEVSQWLEKKRQEPPTQYELDREAYVDHLMEKYG